MRIGRIGRQLTIATTAGACLLAGIVLAGPASATTSYGTVTGVVRGDGLPLGRVVVTALAPPQPPSPLPGATLATTVSAADGTFRIRIPAGSGTFLVQFGAAKATGGTSATGYANACYKGGFDCTYNGGRRLAVPAGRTVALTPSTLSRAAELRGRVVDGLGRGVGSFPMLLWPVSDCRFLDVARFYGSVVTDANGNYRFPGLPAVSVQLCVGSAYYSVTAGTPAVDGYESTSAPVRFTAGAVTVHNATVVGRGGIAGTVVDQWGNPVPGATVAVPVENGAVAVPTTTTSAAGAFRVGGVPTGTQRWCVEAPRYVGSCDGASVPTATVTSFTTAAVGTVVLQRES